VAPARAALAGLGQATVLIIVSCRIHFINSTKLIYISLERINTEQADGRGHPGSAPAMAIEGPAEKSWWVTLAVCRQGQAPKTPLSAKARVARVVSRLTGWEPTGPAAAPF
jgi:hypothetical protein